MGFMLALVVEVVDSVTVCQHDTIVVPFITQDIDEQTITGTTRHALETIVGTHHLTDITFLDQSLEGGQVGLPQVTGIDSGVIRMAQRLRTTVHSIVLGTSMGLEVVRVVTLHTEYGLHTKNGIQVGVLTTSLLTTSPTRVAEDVDIRAPERQLRVAGIISYTHRNIKQLRIIVVSTVPVSTCLVAHLREDIVNQLTTEGGSQTDGLRIDRITILTDTMTSLTPPVIRGDTETVNRHRLVHHQTDFLLRSKQ